jgi:hypothetical protein
MEHVMAEDKVKVQSAGEAAVLSVHEDRTMTDQVRYVGAGITRPNPDEAEARIAEMQDAHAESAEAAEAALANLRDK